MSIALEYNKEKLGEIRDAMVKSNERKNTVKRELAKDRISLEGVQLKETNGDPIPAGSYSSYAQWKEQLQKEITTSECSLDKIAEQELVVIAIEHYIATATD